jgi:hypothetical protein
VSQSRTPSAAPSTPQAQTRQAAPPKDKAEQKSLINRLISRIRSL